MLHEFRFCLLVFQLVYQICKCFISYLLCSDFVLYAFDDECVQWNALNPALLLVQHLRKLNLSLEVPLSMTYRACTDALTLSWVILTLLSPSSYRNDFRTCRNEQTRYF
jgi:hypothetical protein